MRAPIGILVLSLSLVAMTPLHAAAALEVVVDTNGSGSRTFSDADQDNVVDFNETIAGVLEARARVRQTIEGLNSKMAISTLPPFSNGLFRNVSGSPQTITVTVKSATLPVIVTPPLGWDLFYNFAVDDPVDAIVQVPAHSVQAFAATGTVPLATLSGPALTEPTGFALEDHGVDPAVSTADVWIVWEFTLGPNDELLVPSDGGFDGESVQVNVFNHSQKCTDKMNNGGRRITSVAQKMDTKCVKTSIGLATTCIDQPGDIKTVKKQEKLVQDFQFLCNPVPAWGVNSLSCCWGGGANDGDLCLDSSTCGGGECTPGGCVAEIAEAAANELTHDIYGGTVTVASDSRARRCQKTISKSAGKLLIEHMKVFRVCKRDAFGGITSDEELRATCLEPQPDPKGKLATRAMRITADIRAKCLDKGVTTLGLVFPGACATAPDPTFGECISERARCRFCRAVNLGDAIVPPVDCDLFDDAVANSSCTL
jgi:hypothetical protein